MSNLDAEYLAPWLQRWAARIGVTYKDVADAIHVGHTTAYYWFAGKLIRKPLRVSAKQGSSRMLHACSR